MCRKISDCTSKIKHRDPRHRDTDIRKGCVCVCVQTLSLVFLNYSIKFIIHMRVTCVYVWFIRVHPYVHMQHGHKIIVHLRIFICLSFFFLSFFSEFHSHFFLFVYFFFFFQIDYFNPFRFRKRRSKSVVRDLTKESELSRVCTKGRITTSRNVFRNMYLVRSMIDRR